MTSHWVTIGDGPHVCYFEARGLCLYPGVLVYHDGKHRVISGVFYHFDSDSRNDDPSNLAPCHYGCCVLRQSSYWKILGPGPHTCWFAQFGLCLHSDVPVYSGTGRGSKGGAAHHIDGDHSNNDPANLAACHVHCHAVYHKIGRQHTEETKEKMSESAKRGWMKRKIREATQMQENA